jgi:HK97 family phage major capsid protein
MPVDLKALADQRAAALTDAQSLVDKAEAENRDLTADEEKRFGELMAKAKDLEKREKRAADLAAATTPPTPPAAPVPPPPPPTAPGATQRFTPANVITGGDHRRYSLLRAIRMHANKQSLDGFEAEVSQELSKRFGRSPKGFFMPHDFGDPLGQRRDAGLPPNLEQRAPGLTVTSGAGLVPTWTDASKFIELLRNRCMVRALGAMVMNDLSGNFSLPKQSGPGQAYWFNNETSAPTASNQTVTQVGLTPSSIGCYTDISRTFIEQTALDAETFVRDDLAKVMALGVDLAAINGSGQGATPLGILQDSNVVVVPIGTNGGAIDWANVVALETSVRTLNADIGEMAYLTNARVMGALKTTPKVANFPVFLAADDGTVNGFRCGVSNQVPGNLTKGYGTNLCAAIFGVWSQLILAFWSGVDVLVDPYTGGTSGIVRIVMLQDCCIKIRHEEAFAVITDISC